MAVQSPQFVMSYKSDADFSAKQYYFVKFSSTAGEVSICTAATDVPCGVLQNAPDAAGKEAVVMHIGMSKVSSDAALAIGAQIGTSADGQADAKTPGTDTTEYVVGQVVTASTAAAGLVSALINGLNPHRAA